MNKDEWLLDFVSNLTRLMETKKMNQKELARRSCLSRATINRYLNYQRYPSAIAVVNLAYALGCEIEDLIWTFDLVE